MTKIIFSPEAIEVVASPEIPNKGILITLGIMEIRSDDPGIGDEDAEFLSEQAADLILRVCADQTINDN